MTFEHIHLIQQWIIINRFSEQWERLVLALALALALAFIERRQIVESDKIGNLLKDSRIESAIICMPSSRQMHTQDIESNQKHKSHMTELNGMVPKLKLI